MLIQFTTRSEQAFAAGLFGVASAVEEWKPTERFVEAGDPAAPISLSPAAVLAHLQAVLAARAVGTPAIFRLATSSGRLQLFADVEPGIPHPIEFAWFSLTEEDVSLDRIETLIRLVRVLVERSSPFRAVTEDEALLDLYRGAKAFDKARAALPEALRQYLPYQPIRHDAGELPVLLMPHQFDRRRVPEAIWWINYWDNEQLETLGNDRVRHAPWARQVEVPGAGVILVATEHPTNPDNAADKAKLRELIRHTDLVDTQLRHSFQGSA